MDLESECSVGEVGTNGTCHDTDVEGVSVKSPSASVHSPGGSIGSSPPLVTKGSGLKKWRRIRREGGNEGGSNLDSGKPLKRGLSNSLGNANSRPVHALNEVNQKSEGSVSSTNAVVKVLGSARDGVAMYGGDSGSLNGAIFAARTDSENSEDRGSKSSTAASAPRSRYDIPAAVGYGRDKNKMRSVSGKNLGKSISAQLCVQQGKSHVETSKKARGERVKIEKENSHSSMESDSRSSNFVLMQGPHSVTSNGRQSGRSATYDAENSDDAQDGEQHFNGDTQTGFSINEAESEDGSREDLTADDLSWGMKEDKGEKHGSSNDQDAMMEAIITLQSTKEALEKELEKFRYMGKDSTLLSDDSVDAEDLLSECNAVGPEVDDPSSSNHQSLEKQIMTLKENVICLEAKLMEARIMFDMKEAKVIDLEAILNSTKSPKQEERGGSSIDIENELEGIFRQKIEAEIEYLAISETIQTLRVGVVDQTRFLEEEERAIASKQVQVLNKLEDAENKATTRKKEAVKLESSCEEIVAGDEVLKLQTKVSKFTWYFLIQLILLVLVLALFVPQLSTLYGGVVPT